MRLIFYEIRIASRPYMNLSTPRCHIIISRLTSVLFLNIEYILNYSWILRFRTKLKISLAKLKKVQFFK